MLSNQIDGFHVVTAPGDESVQLVVDTSRLDEVLVAGLDNPEFVTASGAVERWIGGGRVPHPVIRVGDEQWLLKSYRRGGLVSLWNQGFYFGRRRFLRELEVCVAAVKAGIPTVVPIALVVKAYWFGAVRAWLLTPFLSDARSLGERLADVMDAGDTDPAAVMRLQRAFHVAGVCVRRMHGAGIDHPDLNLTNLLVTESDFGLDADSSGEASVVIVDWDRARRHARLGNAGFRNLLRLYRSGLKLQRLSEFAASSRGRWRQYCLGSCARSFLRGYFSTAGDPGESVSVERGAKGLRRLKQYYRRRRFLEYLLHRAFRRTIFSSKSSTRAD